MNNQNNISVILPVFNGGNLLKQSVESVLNQNINNFEFLVIDDCSTDGSYEYLKSIEDDRLVLFRNNKNKGLFYNLNYLISKSRTSLIKLWAQDDIMYEDCLTEFIKFHIKHPFISFSYCDRDIIDESGNIILPYDGSDTTPEIISIELHNKIALYTGSIAGNIANICISKAHFLDAGPFKEDMRYSADFDMLERLTTNSEIGKIKKTLIKLRNHSGQLSRKLGYSIYQLVEDQEIFARLINRTPDELKSFAILTQKWKRNVYYFSVLFGFLKSGNWQLLKQYFLILRKHDNILFLSLRWMLVKTSNILGLKIVKLKF